MSIVLMVHITTGDIYSWFTLMSVRAMVHITTGVIYSWVTLPYISYINVYGIHSSH